MQHKEQVLQRLDLRAALDLIDHLEGEIVRELKRLLQELSDGKHHVQRACRLGTERPT